MAEILCHSRKIIETSTDGRTPANPFGPSTISLLEMFLLCMVGGTSIQDALKFKTKSDRESSNLGFLWTKPQYQNNFKHIKNPFAVSKS